TISGFLEATGIRASTNSKTTSTSGSFSVNSLFAFAICPGYHCIFFIFTTFFIKKLPCQPQHANTTLNFKTINYSTNPISSKCQYLSETLPRITSSSNQPKLRRSLEFNRLSPKTKYFPSGTSSIPNKDCNEKFPDE